MLAAVPARRPARRPSRARDAVSLVLPASDPGARETAAGAADRGGLIVVPTDTVYGIAARLDRPDAVAAIFAAKQRPPGLSLPVLVAAADQAGTLGAFDDRAEALARAFWPGPLTIVVARRPTMTADVGGDGATIGLRVPARPDLLGLLARTGPLATTSANRSGSPTPSTVEEILAVFGPDVAVYLDGGPSAGGPPSTVVSLTGPAPVVLREGAVAVEVILATLAR